MAETQPHHPPDDLLTRLGCPHVFAPVKLALGPLWEPGKLLLAVAAFLVSMAFTFALDKVTAPVRPDAVATYVADVRADRVGSTDAQALLRPDDGGPAEGSEDDAVSGVFAAFFRFQTYSAEAAVRALVGADTVSPFPATGASGSAVSFVWDIVLGFWWLISDHPLYSVVLVLGLLAIWALPIGAICRMSAESVCTDQYLSLADAVRYGRAKWFALFTAPLMPLVWVGGTAFLLWLAGLVLSIPYAGDLGAIVMIPVMIVLGAVLSFWVLGLLPAALISWPAVVVDDADPFEAATSRGVAYAFSRLIKSVWYAVVLAVIGGVTTLLVRAALGIVFLVTHAVVSAGTWLAGRQVGEATVNKLDVIWPLSGTDTSAAFARGDVISAFFFKVWTWLAGTVVPGYAAAYVLCALTVWYLLMRRDVDGVPISELSPRK